MSIGAIMTALMFRTLNANGDPLYLREVILVRGCKSARAGTLFLFPSFTLAPFPLMASGSWIIVQCNDAGSIKGSRIGWTWHLIRVHRCSSVVDAHRILGGHEF